MGKRKRDLGSVIEKAVKEKVEETLEEEKEKEEEEQRLLEGGEETPPELEDPALKKILSNFPSTEGYYGKLYRILSSGKEEYKHHLSSLEEISDPEVDIAELAKARKWGSGTYKLRVFKHGESGIRRSLTLLIDASDPNQPIAESSSVPRETAVERMREVADLVNVAREIIPSRESSNSTEKLSQVLSDTLKTGVEIMKEASSRNDGGKGQVLEVITALKEAGVLKSGGASEIDMTERIIKNLKELGLLGAPRDKDDILDRIIKLREAGIVKLSGEERDDALSSVEKIKAIIDLVTPLVNPSGEKPNFWSTLAPHVPRLFDGLITPLKDYLDLRKAELSLRINQAPPSTQRSLPPPGVRTPLVAPPGIEVPPVTEAPKNVHPIIAEIMEAITSRNQQYFPKLQELIVVFAGPHVVEALITGLVSSDTFMSLVSASAFGEAFNTPESKIYLEDFINWAKLDKEKVPPGSLIVKCDKCHEEFEVTLEEFESDKTCECGGILEKVNAPVEEGVANGKLL